MQVRAIICDAASVREGLLHMLGGGITRLWRGEYPSSFSGALAMIVTPEPAELNEDHKLTVKFMGADSEVGRLTRSFRIDSDDSISGDIAAIPVVLSFVDTKMPIETGGHYRFDVLINNVLQDSVGFLAMPAGEKPE